MRRCGARRVCMRVRSSRACGEMDVRAGVAALRARCMRGRDGGAMPSVVGVFSAIQSMVWQCLRGRVYACALSRFGPLFAEDGV